MISSAITGALEMYLTLTDVVLIDKENSISQLSFFLTTRELPEHLFETLHQFYIYQKLP